MDLFYTRNMNPRMAVAAARFLDAPVRYVGRDYQDQAQADLIGSLNPNGLLPILRLEHGRVLWEADAIACHLSRQVGSGFWRQDQSQPDMIRWLSWAARHFDPAADGAYWNRVVLPTFAPDDCSEADAEASIAKWRKVAPVLNDALAGRHWLLGDEISYADFRVAGFLAFPKAGLPVADFPEIARHLEQLNAIPAWADPFDGLD